MQGCPNAMQCLIESCRACRDITGHDRAFQGIVMDYRVLPGVMGHRWQSPHSVAVRNGACHGMQGYIGALQRHSNASQGLAGRHGHKGACMGVLGYCNAEWCGIIVTFARLHGVAGHCKLAQSVAGQSGKSWGIQGRSKALQHALECCRGQWRALSKHESVFLGITMYHSMLRDKTGLNVSCKGIPMNWKAS